MDVAQFLKGAGDRRPSKTVHLSPDPDRLTAAQVASRARDGGTLADPAADVDVARQAAVESAWKFVVSTIPASQWEWLLGQHPPTDQQRQAARGQTLQWNFETFPKAATAACLTAATNPDGQRLEFDRPGWDVDGRLQVDPQATELTSMSWETFPLGDTKLLWSAVLELNGTMGPSAQVQSFANGSAQTRSGGR